MAIAALHQQGLKVVMVTGDKDFIQLVTPAAEIWDPMKEATIDVMAVKETYGLSPAQMIDVQGLSGDTTDNVPGVPGIGPTAADRILAGRMGVRAVDELVAGGTRFMVCQEAGRTTVRPISDSWEAREGLDPELLRLCRVLAL